MNRIKGGEMRETLVKLRIARVEERARGDIISRIVAQLTALTDVQEWMMPGLIEAALSEWEEQERDEIAAYNYSVMQAQRRNKQQADNDDLLPF